MTDKQFSTVDGNTAAAHVAYAFNEVAAIYPITPSSTMGEITDEWSAKGRVNIFNESIKVIEMQSEGGAAGAVHGSLSAGAMTTTFTASQGLLLMMPNMFKIAGEMLPTVFYVAARSLACQSLSIFGDHSDVMATRGTGFALLASNSVQEVHDMAIVAQLATMESKVPFLSFFDGFRTSSEIQKVELADYDILKELASKDHIEEFRSGAMTPDKPFIKVGAQNPDVYFQGRETVNKFYNATPEIVKKYMKVVADTFGRTYHLFDYIGAPDAESLIIAMGSGCETIEETIDFMLKNGEKVGAVKVRLYRPFSVKDFVDAIPQSVKKIAVLDRTKEPGAIGEPLYLDVVTALKDRPGITIIGGRYGLSSKEFTPAMVTGIFTYLNNDGAHDFTVGINDDVTHTSIPYGDVLDTEPEGVIRCKFWGYGSDGTVGANKNSIKIIGDHTDLNVQAYFSYDSKKSGGITISHLRFGKSPIKAQYLLTTSDFVALHNPSYIGRYDILEGIREGGTFLINSPWSPEEAFNHLTREMQETIKTKNLKFYTINATKIADEVGLKGRINTVMQAAFFKLSGILPEQEALQLIKDAIKKTFAKKGEEIVRMNWECVDKTSAALVEATVPDSITQSAEVKKLIPDSAPDFAKDVIEKIMLLKGDSIPVSKMPIDGKVPTGTNKLEKRGVAEEVPHWISENCIQCGQCSFVCPHAAIRLKQILPADLKDAPATFSVLDSKSKNDRDLKFKLQVYVEDCVGCGSCVETCPTKEKSIIMSPLNKERDAGETENAVFFDQLPNDIMDGNVVTSVKGSQFKQPLFEFSGACAGCGETPYVKLVTQLYGDRMIVANATGCSSIYGGTFPTIPYCTNSEGQGPAWANSLFEDNAEYGLGMRLAVNANRKQLKANTQKLIKLGTTPELTTALNRCLELWDLADDEAKAAAKQAKSLIDSALDQATDQTRPVLAKIKELQNYFVNKSVWIFGGDGWAYDIGYGGLDHVLSTGENVNVLVLDTEVYSNTGGQASKSTPRGAVAKFAASGKKLGKKNLGLMMTTYGSIYVASVNMGANKAQVLKALVEAEAYPGPSIIIAYSPCIAHGFNMRYAQAEEKLAADTGYWPVYRYNPQLEAEGKDPFTWESKEPTVDFKTYTSNEVRYRTLEMSDPDEANRLFELAKQDNAKRFGSIQAIKKS